MSRIHGAAPDGSMKAVAVDVDGKVKISGTITADLVNVEDVTVRGTDAAGASPTQPPILIAGSDGSVVRTVALTSTGLVKVEISDVTEGPPLLTEGVIDPGENTVSNAVKPMLVGLNDPSNLLRSLRGAADGTLRVDPTGTTTQPVSGTIAVSGTVPVSGTVTANAGSGTMAVSGPVTDAQLRATAVPVGGSLGVLAATAAALSNVASSATNVTLLASNAARRGATVHNDSTQILYLKLGATASTTSFTVKMAAGDYYELPAPCYTGIIDGIWASANGSGRMTEIT